MTEAVAVHGGGGARRIPFDPGELGQTRHVVFSRRRRDVFWRSDCRLRGPTLPQQSWPVPAAVLGINLTALMTFLLIVSSVTMVLGLAALQTATNHVQKFMGLTILGGMIFLGLQAYEWTHLINHTLPHYKLAFSTHLFATTFFVLTGFHGMHVTGGVIYNSACWWRSHAAGIKPSTSRSPGSIGTLSTWCGF